MISKQTLLSTLNMFKDKLNTLYASKDEVKSKLTHVEITQAEYDKLSDKEKKNGKMYLIKDATPYDGEITITGSGHRELTQAEYIFHLH